MAFTKSNEYYQYKINNIKKAICGTKEALKTLTIQKQIESHESYILSCQHNLKVAMEEYKNFKG